VRRLVVIVPLLAFALLAVVLAVGVKRAPQKNIIESPLIGRPAPEFSLPSLTDPGRTVSSNDLRGRWYLFNVWGTWCPGCRTEHDVLLEIRHSGEVPIIGLNWKDEDEKARQWLAQLGDPYEAVAVDRDGRTAIDWGVYGAPETFLVDPQGTVVYKHIGPLTREVWHEQIRPRLPKQSGAS
jgi:periplasmic protein thiol:disulfide oxidoreductases, DsbE subfamily